MRELSRGAGADLVLDMVGANDTLELASKVVHFKSHLTVVGLAGGSFPFTFGSLPFECSLALPYWGTAVELLEVLELAKAGKIRAHVERFSLDDVGEAYRRMREGTLDGRAVICPHG
jgi:propanol-preferring alcohol dehydrogenase